MVDQSKSDRAFEIVNNIFLGLVLIITLYPLIYVASASISDPDLVNQGKMWLLPKGITFEGFKRVFQDADIWTGYRNTIFYTVLGTCINLIMTFLTAYPLSRKDFYGKNVFTVLFTFTMFFGGGLIPTYLLIKDLEMINTIWALVIPNAVAMWNIVITRTYFQSNIPWELQEAAMIDGCSTTRLFVTIILPLSMPIIAVMALFYGVGHWNSFFSALIYISDRELYPLQLILREILVQQQMSAQMMMDGDSLETLALQAKIAESIKYAVILVATLPVLVIYPFIQKFFIKGIMVGALKG